MWKRSIITGTAALFLGLAGVQGAEAQQQATVTVNVPEVLAIDLNNADVTFTESETEGAILGTGSVSKTPSGATILYRGNVNHEVTVGFAGTGLSDGKILAVEAGSDGFVQIPTGGGTAQLASSGTAGSSGDQTLSWELSGLDINTPPTTGETATVTFTITSP